MNTLRVRAKPKRRRRLLWLLAATASCFLMLSLFALKNSDNSQSRIFSEGVAIKLNRTSPPFAALEDSLSDFDSIGADLDQIRPHSDASETILTAGERSFEAVASWIIAANLQRQKQLDEMEQIHRKATLGLKARVAQLQERLARAVLSSRTEPKLEHSSRVAGLTSRKTPDSDSIPSVAVTAAAPDTLLVTGGKIIPFTGMSMPATDNEMERDAQRAGSVAAVSAEPYVHPMKTIRLAELNIDREELVKSLFFPLVTAGLPKANDPRKSVVKVIRDSQKPRLGGVDDPKRSYRSREVVPDAPSSEVTVQSEPVTQLVISGPLEIAGGLAFTSSRDRLVVYREHEGETFESGYVWIREARYEIFVERTVGLLVAELQTPNGDVLGRGMVDLSEIPPVGKQQYRLDKIAIHLKPRVQGLRGLARSAYSHGSKVEALEKTSLQLKHADRTHTTRKDGRFIDKSFLAGSTVMFRAEKKDFWGTLGFVSTGAENSITLYPDKMINAFMSLVSSGTENSANQDVAASTTAASAKTASEKKDAIIWGKVVRGGQPVSGARVELLTGSAELKPVYFNSLLLPDPTLTETTANGLYAFFPVEPGVHSVQGEAAGAKLDPVLFATEAGFVSHVDLETKRASKVDIKVFDAFQTHIPLAAHLTPLGAEAGFDIRPTGKKTFRYASGSGLLLLDVNAGDEYAIMRFAVERERRYAFAPMLKRDWLDEFRNHRRITREPRTGVMAGFVQSREAYQVFIETSGDQKSSKIVYFDPRGRLLDGQYGVPGGGYVIFNAPEGLATISVQSTRRQEGQAVTALIDQSVVSVANHSLK